MGALEAGWGRGWGGGSRCWVFQGRSRDARMPWLRAGQAGGSLLPQELLDLLCPPPLPGREAAQPLSSLFPATCFAGSNSSAQSTEGSAPNPERVRGSGWPGSGGLETWLETGAAGVEEAGVRASRSQEELRTQTPGLSRERETRSPDSWVPG